MSKRGGIKMSKQNGKTVVIVPFFVIEHYVKFRYEKHFWTKKIGCTNYAYQLGLKDHFYVSKRIEPNELVAVLKSNISKKCHFEIKKEIKA